jgi:hypothetical protein
MVYRPNRSTPDYSFEKADQYFRRSRCDNCTNGGCKSRHATGLLVGVAELCVSVIPSLAAPSGNDDGHRWFYV